MPTTVTADVARNRVKIALYDLYLKHKASLAKVRVQEKPKKLVLCKNTVKEGEIKLVAMTTTITTNIAAKSSSRPSLDFGDHHDNISRHLRLPSPL